MNLTYVTLLGPAVENEPEEIFPNVSIIFMVGKHRKRGNVPENLFQ